MPTHIRVDELAAELGVPEGTVVAELKTLGKPMMLGYAMVDEHSADKVRARISVPPASPDLDSRPMRVIDLAEELSVAFEGSSPTFAATAGPGAAGSPSCRSGRPAGCAR